MKQLSLVVIALFLLAGFSQAQSKFGASLQGGVSLPMGDFGDGFETGFGGSGSFLFNADDNVALFASVGYFTWESKFFDVSLNDVPVLVGGRYYFTTEKIKPYLTAGLGMHFLSASEGDESEEDFGFLAGAGVLFGLSDEASIDLTASFNSISTEGSSTDFINISAGIAFGF